MAITPVELPQHVVASLAKVLGQDSHAAKALHEAEARTAAGEDVGFMRVGKDAISGGIEVFARAK